MLGGKDVNRVATHTESAARKIHVIALVLHAHQLHDHVALAQLVACTQRHHHLVVGLGLADTVDRRHRGDDDHIAPLQYAFGARQTHLLNVLINCRVFLDKQIALRHISLGLVVVVITDEILHRVVREKLAELAVKLRSQSFVGGKNNRRPAQSGNHIGHGEGLARTGHPQQGLKHLAVSHAFDQLRNRRRLVARRGIGLVQLKGRVRKTDIFAGTMGGYDFEGFRHGLR